MLTRSFSTQANPFVKDLILLSPVLRRYVSNIAALYFPEYRKLLDELAADGLAQTDSLQSAICARPMSFLQL
jgi:hypothetical protein